MAAPVVAAARAGASLTPSPASSTRGRRPAVRGRRRPCPGAAARPGRRRCRPGRPAAAARSLSPVSSTGELPVRAVIRSTAAAAAGRRRSAMPSTATGLPSMVITAAVCPSSSSAATTAVAAVPARGRWRRTADLDPVAADQRGHAASGQRGELGRRRRHEAGVAGRSDDRAAQWVLGRVLGGCRQFEDLALVPPAARQYPDLRQPGGALGEGAGLVERDQAGRAGLLHDDGGLDQDAVAAGVGHRGQQRRHGRQDDRARRGHDHERHRPQQRRLEGAAGQQRDGEQEHGRGHHAE